MQLNILDQVPEHTLMPTIGQQRGGPLADYLRDQVTDERKRLNTLKHHGQYMVMYSTGSGELGNGALLPKFANAKCSPFMPPSDSISKYTLLHLDKPRADMRGFWEMRETASI